MCDIAEQIVGDYDAKMIHALQIAFDVFDEMNQNEIPVSDLERIMCSLEQNVSLRELDELGQSIDRRNKGKLEFNDFIMETVPFLRQRYAYALDDSHEKIRYIFAKIDRDGDGILCMDDVQHVVRLALDGMGSQVCVCVSLYLYIFIPLYIYISLYPSIPLSLYTGGPYRRVHVFHHHSPRYV